MKNSYPRSLALLSLVAAALVSAADDKADLLRRTPVASTEQIPIVDFVRADFISEPKINLAGTHVAAILTAGEDRTKLVVYELGSMKVEAYDPPGQAVIYDVNWLTDGRLAFRMSLFKGFGGGLYATEVGRMAAAYPLLQNRSSTLLAVPLKDRTRPLVSVPAEYNDAGRDGQVFKLNTEVKTGRIINMMMVAISSGDSELIEESNRKVIEERILGPSEGYDAGFMADFEGKVAFGFTSQDGRFAMHRRVGNEWQRSPVDLEEVDVIGFGRTRDEVIVRGPRVEGLPRVLQFMDTASGTLGDELLKDESYDFSGWLYYQPGTNALLGASFDRNGPAMAWFNPDYVNLQKVLEGYFPGLVVRLTGADEQGKVLLVETYSDRHAPVYYCVDLEKRSFGPIEKSMPWLEPERMRPTSIIKYKTADGKRIDAYVTLPAGASKEKPAPLIVIPPGIPQIYRSDYRVPRERAAWRFDKQVQLWASRGYAVLQPNHRGSAGYGWMFPREDEWAFNKMAEDIVAATRLLAGSGYVDPKRIGIQGSGSAAYLAVAAAIADPDLFKAVVGIQGTYDWPRHLRNVKDTPVWEVNHGVLSRHLAGGNLDAISINDKLGRIRGAVLVGYQRELGEATAQSTSLASGLERAGVATRTVAVGGDRSPLNLVMNQAELNSKIAEFYAERLHQ